jgi:iron complex outermembrane receptor protein
VPVRDLPLTVAGVSSAVIAEQGVNDLVTALKNVSGVYPFTTYGVYEYYSFRGFLSSVQLVDGVRNEGNRVNTQLTSIERVEVLKGPSSALYGGSALGATVNLIRKKPSATPTYDAMAPSATGRRVAARSAPPGGWAAATPRFIVSTSGPRGATGTRHDEAKRFTMTPSLAWRLGANNQVNVYYTLNRDQFGGDAGLPLVDTSLETATEDNIPDVPRDRNYRTPQDDATSLDHNIQLSYARQINNSLGFRDTLSYRPLQRQVFPVRGSGLHRAEHGRSLLPLLQPSPPAADEHRRADRAHPVRASSRTSCSDGRASAITTTRRCRTRISSRRRRSTRSTRWKRRGRRTS